MNDKVLAPYLPEGGKVAIDVGASVGHWLPDLCPRYEQVHAFEPNPDNLPLLTAAAECFGNAEVHAQAVGAHHRRAMLHLDAWGELATLAPERVEWVAGRRPSGRTQVEVVPLDQFAFPDVHLLKVDTEGYEREVIAGAANTIELWHPVLIVETHSRDDTLWLTRFLLEQSYGEVVLVRDLEKGEPQKVHVIGR